jgi:hypothetical protein
MSLGLKAELLLANSSQGATREECLNVNAKKRSGQLAVRFVHVIAPT